MAINLKTVLDGNKGQSELSIILQTAKQSILDDIELKKTKAKLEPLQGTLNDIFYPIGKTVISANYYDRRVKEATEEEIINVFNNFDFESNTKGYYTAKVAIAPSTLKNSIMGVAKPLETLIKKIESLGPYENKDHLISLKEQVEKLKKEGYQILNQRETIQMFGKERIAIKENDPILSIINQLKAFANILSDTDFVSPQEAGILFEEALALTNIKEQIKNDVIDDEIRQIALESQFGSETIQRGQSGTISYTVSMELFNNNTKAAKSKGFKINKGGMTCTYTYNPSEKKQGKMDVQLNYGSDNIQDLRVSAKRWSHGSGDLGETSIDAGIHRAAGQSVANAYKFAILNPKRDQINGEVPTYNAVNTAHEFATLALKSDIAMGLNQGITNSGAGYANILIVDTGTSIKVRDLASIVKDNEAFKLSGYNADDILSEANRVYNSMSNIKQNRTQSYLGLMTSVLNKMKVTINLSFKKKEEK